MRYRLTFGEKVFDALNYIVLLIACAAVMLPFLYIIASSLSSPEALIRGEVTFWPKGLNLTNYQVVMENKVFWRSFGITLFIVIVGTAVNMFMTVVTAYPLAKQGLKGKNIILLLIVFTMIFQAPMIPTYLIVKNLHLLNTVWALIIPGAISAFNMFICLTFFRSLPEELFEAARVDGMKEFSILWRIAVPLSTPIMVTLILFYAVSHWNNYFSALLYINDFKQRPLQLYLYNLIAQFNMNEEMASLVESNVVLSPQGLQMATILVATVPILLVYPFIQKHFIKGALIGSIKE